MGLFDAFRRSSQRNTKMLGDEGEEMALRFLSQKGLRLVERNFKTQGRGGGEIDLIMQDGDTLVFVEVRLRKNQRYGGAAASVGLAKQRRSILAARHFLQQLEKIPPCRFDVVAIDDHHIEWLPNAFTAD